MSVLKLSIVSRITLRGSTEVAATGAEEVLGAAVGADGAERLETALELVAPASGGVGRSPLFSQANVANDASAIVARAPAVDRRLQAR
jgi:hypothetical protein